jgi:guanosine-diphosphatase
MRRTSVSLPTRNADPHEKPARYTSHKDLPVHRAGILDNLKAAWMTQSQRSRYVKTGGILLFIVFLFYFLAPTGTNVHIVGTFFFIKWSTPHKLCWMMLMTAWLGGKGGQTASDPSVGTTKCSKSSDPSKPIIQYALMIDAGSTGSRIHVYRFNNCGSSPELEDEQFKMTEKKPNGSGLSSYPDDPEAAAMSLDVLMEVAMNTIPEKLRACSPIAVKATAGLRILGLEKSEKILDAVRHRLETSYPFPVVSKEENGVAIMDGSDEGVYAWITTNYLLGKIGGPDHSETAAVFDLGGGSTQIVFEPTFKSPSKGMPEKLADGDHKYELNFGGRKFQLYQHSHLGYGLMVAREAIHKALIDGVHQTSLNDQSWVKAPVTNPCIAPGMTKSIEVQLGTGHDLGESITVNMTGPSSPAPAQCRGLAEKILQKDTECTLAPCSFNGVHQPSLAKTFSREDIYAFSYFYDRLNPLGMPESFTLKEIHDLTSQVCGGESSWDMFEGVPGAMEQLRDRPEWCLDLNFMMALLHTGYELPIDRELKTAKKIKGNELGWCLGAR